MPATGRRAPGLTISTSFELTILDTMKASTTYLFNKRVNKCQGDGFQAWVHERAP